MAPIYDFVCPRCATRKEAMQKYEDPPPSCPECGGPMDRAVSRAGFVLKGDGWSRDDYGLRKPRVKAEGEG